MKVLLDGPQPDAIAPHRSGQYESSKTARQAQFVYRKLFGSKPLRRQTSLPRRETGKRGCRNKGLQAFLRRREHEIQKAGLQASSQERDKAAEFEKFALAEAECGRKRKEFASYSKTVQEKAQKKQKLLEALSAGDTEACAKLKADKDKAAAAPQLQRMDLQIKLEQQCFLQPELCLVVSVRGEGSESMMTSTQRDLMEKKLGLTVVTFAKDGSMAPDLLRARHLIWFAPTCAEETSFIDPHNPSSDLSGVLIASRLFGGHVAGPEWLSFCKPDKILEPVLRIKNALRLPLELCLHESIPQKPLLLSLIVAAAKDPEMSGETRWVVQGCRKKLSGAPDLLL